ncbi:prion-inhibition and propagation-domain-containing protein [Rhypophila decipiens]|uniref:Prion-inhibition and propagation-domain-containing protein n=1 Tax=Rhypophila decipiens TaxID=261697 RepID=A0AAN6Y2M2_9PEZI|nr:prion-inhibition and propagation-domain-containing protein [Rhypophila decipiens]
MDPVSAAGLAIGVASIGLQVYTGCIQGIQLIITALNFPEECRYLNLRLRLEQQRLIAWSETSGLLDLDAKQQQKILASNTFVLHRQTVLDLLVQVQCLFKEFQEQQKRNSRLQTTADQDGILEKPEKDAAQANFPLSEKRRDFIKRAMLRLKETSEETVSRLRWVAFDKTAFETLLSKFSALNDSMTTILDTRMQVEIHHSVQDTNRGLLQLHHRIADLSRLVMALNMKMEANSSPAAVSQMSEAQKRANADGFERLSQLAKFKAFNQSIEAEKKSPWDEATAMWLELGKPNQRKNLLLDRSKVRLGPGSEDLDLSRCEAVLELPGGGEKKVWIEWKEYDRQRPEDLSPPKEVIIERVANLAALLNHTPKPEAFRTPHCLGFFDMATTDDEEDILNLRLGLVFERPDDDNLPTSLPPVSLNELLQTSRRKPSVTDRIKLAHAVSNCLHSLHVVNWLHKGLRSHNIIFFRTSAGHVDYSKPYLSGFDFSRPARPDEMTDIPGDVEHNLYRHPHAQSSNPEERERFKKSFDIYSLGVLFVEIAHWATLDKILQVNINAARGRPSIALRVRQNLLAPDMISEVGAGMGQVFEDATRKCLAGGKEFGLSDADEETDDVVAARLSKVLYEEVVKTLADVRI